MGSVPDILSGAKKALEKANSFTKGVESKTPFSKPERPASRSQYSQVRDTRRKSPGEFMGMRSDESPELKSAEAARGQYKDAMKAAGQE